MGSFGIRRKAPFHLSCGLRISALTKELDKKLEGRIRVIITNPRHESSGEQNVAPQVFNLGRLRATMNTSSP